MYSVKRNIVEGEYNSIQSARRSIASLIGELETVTTIIQRDESLTEMVYELRKQLDALEDYLQSIEMITTGLERTIRTIDQCDNKLSDEMLLNTIGHRHYETRMIRPETRIEIQSELSKIII